MHRRMLAVGILAATAMAGPVGADRGSFGDWTAVCDNTRACTAYGFGADEAAEMQGYLKLQRDGTPEAAPRISLTALGAPTSGWKLSVDGKLVATLGAVQGEASFAGDDALRGDLSAAQTRALLAALPNGRLLTIGEPAKPVATLSLKGSAAALRWIDDRQRRAGTVSALVAVGPKPASSVPAPPEPPVIRAAAPRPQTGLPSAPPAAVKAMLSDCDEDIASVGIEPIVARLSPGVVFWGMACSRGAYNVVYSLFLADETGAGARPATVRYAEATEPTNSLMNIDFDPKTQTLSNFDKGRGLGDCGGETAWVWDGTAFRLKHETSMPECRGVLPDDWAVEHRTR